MGTTNLFSIVFFNLLLAFTFASTTYAADPDMASCQSFTDGCDREACVAEQKILTDCMVRRTAAEKEAKDTDPFCKDTGDCPALERMRTNYNQCLSAAQATGASAAASTRSACEAKIAAKESTGVPVDRTQKQNEDTAAAQSELNSCREATSAATESCNNDGTTDQFVGMLQGVGNTLTGASLADPCSKLADITLKMNLAFGAYESICLYKYNNCYAACSKAAEYDSTKDQWRPLVRTCNSFRGEINKLSRRVMTSAAQALAGKNCVPQASDTPAVPDSVYCAVPEHLPEQRCITFRQNDCSNPSVASTSQVCLCAAGSPQCTSGFNLATGIDTNTSGGNPDFSTSTSSSITATPDFNSGNGEGLTGVNNQSSSSGGGGSGGSSSGGGGGGLLGGGGGGGQPGARPGPGGKAPSNLPKIGSTGRGAPGAGSGAFGGGGGGGSGAGGIGGSGSGTAEKDPAIDLKQFMPGGARDPQRRVAGIAGPDGLIPGNVNIFLNMKNAVDSRPFYFLDR